MSKRTDIVYGTKEVKVASSWIGHDVGHVKPGYWINFRHPGEDQVRTARAICTVSTTGTADPHIKDWLVVAEMSSTCDSVFERWINPEWVIRSTPFPPARVLEFMFSDFRHREEVIQFIDNGFPTGFNMYQVLQPPEPDPRWQPARLVKEDEPWGFNTLPEESDESRFRKFSSTMLAHVASMGASEAGMSLAAQLFGVGPCPGCGYRKVYCKCGEVHNADPR